MRSIQDEVREVIERTAELKAELERIKSETPVNRTYRKHFFSPESQLVEYLNIPQPVYS